MEYITIQYLYIYLILEWIKSSNLSSIFYNSPSHLMPSNSRKSTIATVANLQMNNKIMVDLHPKKGTTYPGLNYVYILQTHKIYILSRGLT